MTQFLLKVVCFAGLQCTILILVLAFSDLEHEENYLAAIIDKHTRCEQIESPRIILVGGSNLPFGIDSSLLERECGRPTINCGLVAGVGIDFLLNEAREISRKGDWIVLSFEYDLFGGGYDPTTIAQLLEFRPACIRHLTVGHFNRVILDRGLSTLGGAVRRSLYLRSDDAEPSETSVYSRHGFNAFGDLVAHHGRPATLESFQPVVSKLPNPKALESLRKFTKHCQDTGIHVAFSFPPQPQTMYESNAAGFQAHYDALKRIPSLLLLDFPQHHAYDVSLFFDTGYHLTKAGAQKRTKKLARALRNYLQILNFCDKGP